MAENGLTPKQCRFVDEYLVDLNATQAAVRAGYSKKTAGEQGARLLVNVKVKKAIEERQTRLQEETQISQREVLQRWLDIATANPNDLTEHRRVPCRYCYGIDHQYQWRTEVEFKQALKEAAEGKEPDDGGGYGYTTKKAPNPDCPMCDGDGSSRLVLKDTRHIPPSALALLKGAKNTKDGLVIEMHDQATALNNIAKHIGMFREVLDVNMGVQDDVLEKMAQIEQQSREQSRLLAAKLEERENRKR